MNEGMYILLKTLLKQICNNKNKTYHETKRVLDMYTSCCMSETNFRQNFIR